MDIVKKHIKEFIYNNQSSKDFNLKIKRKGVKITGSELDVEEVEIPGRKNLHKINGKKENIKIEIECYLDVRNSGFEAEEFLREIKNWLQGDISYKELYFDDEETYYEAICFNKLDIKEILSKYGECKITFVCKSKKSRTGDNFIEISNGFNLKNNYDISKPIIKVIGDGDITININNQEIILKSIEGNIEIDNFLMNAYKVLDNEIINQNNKMYSDFVVLEKGNNKITYSGNVSKLLIKPRWEIDD